ncbi:alpha/beta fold hydrolase [Hyunsoonleella aestuarii]|uniref:Alpha/beta hydrolase n=1 Tax=Hyunsoonleella aestuarii TaxID=912802 RepID=A0ABP8E8G3_9FLAO|nr:alpha/beta hydrolase [Hyunsoonleella aestuarii]
MILEYKGVNIFYTDDGQGEAIILLHGFLENHTIWNPFILDLAKKNRVVTLDLPGHGKSGCLGYIHTMEMMADVLKATLMYLKINKFQLIGHSMGGYIALAFLEAYPNYAQSITLVNSTSLDDSPEKKTNRDRAIVAVKHDYKTFIRIAISNLFNQKNKGKFKQEIDNITNEALKTPLQGIVAALEGMKIRKNRAEIIKSFNGKKMMIASKEDPVLSYNLLVEESKRANVQMVVFPDGHMSIIENKGLFLQQIMHFIEK